MSRSKHAAAFWDRVFYWRGRLNESANYPALASLEDFWQRAQDDDQTRQMLDNPQKWGNDPVSSLLNYIESGFYPPPELLLAIQERFQFYIDTQSDLETCLFGPPIPRAGHHAKRRNKADQDSRIRWNFAWALHRGLSRIDAAEEVVTELGLEIDAESLLRQLRGYKGFPLNKKTDE